MIRVRTVSVRDRMPGLLDVLDLLRAERWGTATIICAGERLMRMETSLTTLHEGTCQAMVRRQWHFPSLPIPVSCQKFPLPTGLLMTRDTMPELGQMPSGVKNTAFHTPELCEHST